MGNYKFKLSDMIPNAWFYKLKDMNKLQVRRNHQLITSTTREKQSPVPFKITNHDLSEERKSYHFTRPDHFHQNSSPIKTTTSISDKYLEPPRKSSRRRRRSSSSIKRQAVPPNRLGSAGCSFRATIESNSFSSEHGSMLPEYGSDDSSPSSKCKLVQNDMVELDMVSLPPIITKKKHDQQHPVIRRFSLNSSSSPGVKLRTNTPRIVNRGRRMIQGGRKSLTSSSSYAVVKSSKDPRRDFRESMVEMIVENNIRGPKDLEDLLACYLSLNSNHYHHLIIDVFKQLWFDFIHVPLN